MRRVLRWGVPTGALLLIAIYLLVSYLVAVGVTSAERKEQEDHPDAYGLDFEEVQFTPRDGAIRLEGWYIPTDGGGATLIFVHGIDSIRTANGATDLAARLSERGFSILLFDLRGHGSSGEGKITGGLSERLDLLGAFDFLVERGTAPGRIGVLGFSMGAGTSLLALAEEPAIRALVADSPYADASDLIAQEMARKTVLPKWLAGLFVPGAKLAAELLMDVDIGKLVPEKAVARLDYPILVVHGTGDTRIPVDHGVRVHLASHPDSELWLVPDVDHVDAFLERPEEYVERIASYFGARLDRQ